MSDATNTVATPVRKRRELPPAISLTPKAADKLARLYAADPGRGILRVSVNSKGCSGKSYDLTWVAEPGPGDERVKVGEVSLLIDRNATLFLIGAGITRASLAKVGVRPLVHGVLLWMVVASLSLVAVLRGVVG